MKYFRDVHLFIQFLEIPSPYLTHQMSRKDNKISEWISSENCQTTSHKLILTHVPVPLTLQANDLCIHIHLEWTLKLVGWLQGTARSAGQLSASVEGFDLCKRTFLAYTPKKGNSIIFSKVNFVFTNNLRKIFWHKYINIYTKNVLKKYEHILIK